MSASLTKPLAIPVGEASVRLQYGHPVARNGVQETDPHCILELDTVAQETLTVAPETFRIDGIRRREETFSGMPVLVRNVMGTGLGRDGGPSHIYYVTEFRLRSDKGTQVRNLTCQHNVASVAIPHHLTLAEIRQALGDYFSLDLPR
ncbi:MAG: hypothetical protein HGA75_12470 [Thiobacillus sp.]|nr:hypothetical protein [Thiobacillus sp.]